MFFPKTIPFLLLLLLTPTVWAGGMSTHMFQSEKAYKQIVEPELKQLLDKNRNAWISGTQYPDAGYSPGFFGKEQHVWGEASHWAPFIERYLDVVIEQCQGRYLTDPECGQLAAHFLGAAAHGLQDEVYDSLFIPKVTEIDHKGQETTDLGIDMILLMEHNRNAFIPNPWYTPVEALEIVYARMGFSTDEANRSQIISATKISELGNLGERLIAPFLYRHYKNLMPWGSRNYMTYPGGVEFGGQVTANLWRYLWKRLNGEADRSEVKLTHLPKRDANNIAINKSNTESQISVVFDRYIIPASVNNTSFRVLDDSGQQVSGSIGLFANSQQNFAEAHMIKFWPYETFRYDTQYRVVLDNNILDETGNSVFGLPGYEWTFRTESANDYVQLSSQGFCLGLRHYNAASADIILELRECGTSRHQQWYVDSENRWHNRARADLCLQPTGTRLAAWQGIKARSCSESTLQKWHYDSTNHSMNFISTAKYGMGTLIKAWAGTEIRTLPQSSNALQRWELIRVED